MLAARGGGVVRCHGGCKQVVAGQYSWPAQHTLMALTSPLLQIAAIMQQRFLGKHTPNCMRCGSRGVARRRPEERGESERGEREGDGGGRWHLGWRLEDAVSHLLLLLPLGPWLHFIFHFSQYPATCTAGRGISYSNISNYSSASFACHWRFSG